jgi:hypothetical protein
MIEKDTKEADLLSDEDERPSKKDGLAAPIKTVEVQ